MTDQRLEGDIWPFLDEHAPRLVARYFDVDPFTDESFTGGRFDTLGVNDPGRFTGDDVVAVSS